MKRVMLRLIPTAWAHVCWFIIKTPLWVCIKVLKTCHLKQQHVMLNTLYWELGDKVKRTFIFDSVETPACLASRCHVMSFHFPSAGDRFLHSPTSSLWSSMTLSLRHSSCTFPHHELSCISAPSSSSLFLVFYALPFFLTFNNTEKFKSRKIVLELSVQCNFLLFPVNIWGHPLQLWGWWGHHFEGGFTNLEPQRFNLVSSESWSETESQMRLRGPSEGIKKKI